MSAIEARGKGWLVRFRQGGKSRARTFPSRDLAERWQKILDAAGPEAALAMLGDDQAGRDAAAGLAVAAWVGRHIDALTGVTDGTRKEYRSYLARHIAPHALGALPLAAVTRDSVAAWVNWLEVNQALSGKSIKNRHSLLSAAFTAAVRAEKMTRNPAQGIRLPRTIGRDMVLLTHDEFAILLDATPDRWKPLIATLAATGLRFGEATALRVRDLDLNSLPPYLRVEQAWKRTGLAKQELGPPKTRLGRRMVELPPEVLPDLRRLTEGRDGNEFVFTNSRGGPVRQASFHDKHWDRIRARARERGLNKDVTLHSLRHCHAVWLMQAGVNPEDIQSRLGHESIKTTYDVYGRFRPTRHQAVLRAVSVAVSPALPMVEDAPLEIES